MLPVRVRVIASNICLFMLYPLLNIHQNVNLTRSNEFWFYSNAALWFVTKSIYLCNDLFTVPSRLFASKFYRLFSSCFFEVTIYLLIIMLLFVVSTQINYPKNMWRKFITYIFKNNLTREIRNKFAPSIVLRDSSFKIIRNLSMALDVFYIFLL